MFSFHVTECLKMMLKDNELSSSDDKICKATVARRIELGSVDLSLDPLFKSACAMDLSKYCLDVPVIEAQQTECLSNVLQSNKHKLRSQCEKFVKKRLAMLTVAVKEVPMVGFQDLYLHLSQSPNRNYFLSVTIGMICFIFVFGLICGRATRRARQEFISKVR